MTNISSTGKLKTPTGDARAGPTTIQKRMVNAEGRTLYQITS